MSIVLKDRNNVDVIFNIISNVGGKITLSSAGSSGTLADARKLEISLKEGANANRVKVKLSIPSTCTTGCTTEVSYVQVASQDITVVRKASTADREDLAAFAASLAASTMIAGAIVEGAL